MIDEDFRTLLLATLPTGVIVEKGKISEEQVPTRVYFQRSNENNDLDLDGVQGLATTIFDVEVAALDDDATTQTMAEQLNAAAVSVTLTQLNGAVNTTTRTIVVDSTAKLPSSGLPFIVLIGSEKLAVTAVDDDGVTMTATRGYKGTTQASHADNAPVVVQGLNGYRGAIASGYIHGAIVSDQSDDYQPKLLDADEGYAVASFQVTVIHE